MLLLLPEEDSDDEPPVTTFLPKVTTTGRSIHISKRSSSVSKDNSRSKDIETSEDSDSDRGILSELSQNSRGDRRYEQAQSSIMAPSEAKKLEAKTKEVKLLQASSAKQKATLEAQIAELQQKLKEQAPVADVVSDDVAGKVQVVLRSQYWRGVKFLRCEEDLKKCVEFVAPKIPVWQKKHGGKTPDSEDYKREIKQFTLTYGPTITKCMNEYRSTCQSQMKKAWKELMDAGKDPPTPAQLLQVALRKGLFLKSDSEQVRAKKQEWFLWYWDKLLPKAAGKGNWNESQRHYGTLSSFCPKNQPGLLVITSATEGSTNVMYENVYSRWVYEYHQNYSNLDVDPKNPAMKPKFSDCKVGQNKWGGWGTAGRKRYYDLLGQFKEVRKNKKARKVEDWALKMLQEKHKIAEKEAKRAMKGGTKRKINEVVDDGYVEYVESGGEEGSEEENELADEEEEIPDI